MDHHASSSESQGPIIMVDAVISHNAELTMPRVTSSSSLTNLTMDKPNSLRRRRPRSFSDSRIEKGALLSPTFQRTLSPKTRRRDPDTPRRRRLRRSRWLIRADHPMKILWDLLTVLLSLMYIYVTHTSIRDRSVRQSNFGRILDAWFLVDILLNFVTEYRTDQGLVLHTQKAVWARYLTTWFVVDALSLVPWETLYVKPIIEMQNKRHFLKKYFFRTKAVIRVTRVLRGRHFRLFGKVAKHTRHAGVGANRLLRLLIKYVPKYLLFYRNMKGVLAVRVLRQVHWLRKFMRNFVAKRVVKTDDATDSLTLEEMDEDFYWEGEEDEVSGIVEIEYDEQYLDDDIGLY
jgi:hypothetical protein